MMQAITAAEWMGFAITIMLFALGAFGGFVTLLVKLGKLIAALDALSEKVGKLSDDVEQWRETQTTHGERIAALEGASCDERT